MKSIQMAIVFPLCEAQCIFLPYLVTEGEFPFHAQLHVELKRHVKEMLEAREWDKQEELDKQFWAFNMQPLAANDTELAHAISCFCTLTEAFEEDAGDIECCCNWRVRVFTREIE